MTHDITLLRRWTVARDTVALAFAKPAGFTFKAGQSIDFTLLDPPATDAKGNTRPLSLVSAPHEAELMIATRARASAFKRTLRALVPGARVRIDGPFGAFTLHGDRSRPAIFIAGGIGVTPFMSIVRQALHDGLPQVMKLLYSNHAEEDAPFLAELQELERRHAGTFSLVPTMTDRARLNGWRGRSGLIDADLVRSIIVRPSRPVFYAAGPPAMVAGMRALLNGMKIEDDDIRSEDFSGY